jgi:hypothetical protein
VPVLRLSAASKAPARFGAPHLLPAVLAHLFRTPAAWRRGDDDQCQQRDPSSRRVTAVCGLCATGGSAGLAVRRWQWWRRHGGGQLESVNAEGGAPGERADGVAAPSSESSCDGGPGHWGPVGAQGDPVAEPGPATADTPQEDVAQLP